jgi:hypothetical protein
MGLSFVNSMVEFRQPESQFTCSELRTIHMHLSLRKRLQRHNLAEGDCVPASVAPDL